MNEIITSSDVSESIEKLNKSFEQLGKDIDRIVQLFGEIKSRAKSQPPKPKYHQSPYAKFDKYHKKKRK